MITIIYDDRCAFCAWCRRFVEARTARPITFVGYDSEQARALLSVYPELYERRKDTIIVFEKKHVPVTKFRACRAIARAMRRPWPTIAAVLGIVPPFLGNLGYDLIGLARPLLSRLVS